MAYVDPDYPSKKAFKKAVAAGKQHQPYPKPHRWYADCDVTDGVITKVR